MLSSWEASVPEGLGLTSWTFTIEANGSLINDIWLGARLGGWWGAAVGVWLTPFGAGLWVVVWVHLKIWVLGGDKGEEGKFEHLLFNIII